MVPGPALDGNNEDASSKNHNVVVKSEAVCMENCEGSALHAVIPVSCDVVARVGSSGDKAVEHVEFVKDDQGECTEYSSSFGNPCSESDDEMNSGLSGMEVDSPSVAHKYDDPATFDGLPRLFRRKKVTAQWRKTVGPLMWRCQWLELRMKDLLSQVSRYDKELALIKHDKDLQMQVIEGDDSILESAQLDFHGHDRSSMKRKKRRRHEDTMDSSLYIRKHKILSYYYEKQNKGAETDSLSVDDFNSPVGEDVNGSLGTHGLLESKENDRILEQLSLKEILLRIVGVQSRVRRLQDHLNKALCKPEKEASAVDHTQVKVPQKSKKTQKRLSSSKKSGNSLLQKTKNLNSLLRKKDGDRPLVAEPPTLSNRVSDDVMEDVKSDNLQKGTAPTIHPDISETMVVRLFGAGNPLANGQMGDLCKENTDDVLIDNQAAKEGAYQHFEKVKHPSEKPEESVEKVAKTSPSKEENTSGPVVKQEPVLETLPVVKPVYSGKKRGRKPKKRGGSKDGKAMSSKTPPAKKKTEIAPSKLNVEKKAVLVTVNSRRSQRIRKPKIY